MRYYIYKMSSETSRDVETRSLTDSALRLLDINTLSDRYKDIMTAETVDIEKYIEDNSLSQIDCQCGSRYHRLHEQLNDIIDRLNQIEILLAAIARNTQAITVTKTTK